MLANSSFQAFSITAQSAAITIRKVDRILRHDARKVAAATVRIAQVLTSREAVKTYKTVWNGIVLIATVAIALAVVLAIAIGLTVRDWADALVESSLTETAPAPTPEPETEATATAIACAPARIAPTPDPEPAPSQNWEAMSAVELRGQCQESGIQWRNVRGKGKHLPKAEMVAALAAA